MRLEVLGGVRGLASMAPWLAVGLHLFLSLWGLTGPPLQPRSTVNDGLAVMLVVAVALSVLLLVPWALASPGAVDQHARVRAVERRYWMGMASLAFLTAVDPFGLASAFEFD